MAAEDRITVRPLLSTDRPSVREIYAEGITAGNATFEPAPPSWEDFDRDQLPDHRFVAVDDDDAPAVDCLGRGGQGSRAQ